MRVLLLDTAFAADPIYQSLVSAGHEVWVMGNRPGDLLARRAGYLWIEQDYSNVDAVEHHVKERRIECVVPGCTDVSIATCVKLSVMQSRTDSDATNNALSDKELFRSLCEEVELRAPRIVREESGQHYGRLICKPVDSFSGRGISIVDGQDAVAVADAFATARAASPSSRAILETFVEGQLHSCTGFVENGRIVDPTYVIEGSSANPFAVDTSYVTEAVPATARSELEGGLSRLAQHLGLMDGLLHTQFLLAEDGAHVVEVSRRCPGDLYPLLIEMSTGLPHAARYAAYFTGDPIPPTRSAQHYMVRHTVTADRECTFAGLRMHRQLPVAAFYPLLPMGAGLLGRQGNRAGILFCEAESSEHMFEIYSRFIERRLYDVN